MRSNARESSKKMTQKKNKLYEDIRKEFIASVYKDTVCYSVDLQLKWEWWQLPEGRQSIEEEKGSEEAKRIMLHNQKEREKVERHIKFIEDTYL